MEEVVVRKNFPHSADTVWQLTGDFSGLKHWLPGVVDCTVDGAGARDQGGNAQRSVQLMDGSIARESLESFDAENMQYGYAILEAQGFSEGQQFSAHFQVQSTEPDGCEVIWIARFSMPKNLPEDKIEKARQRVSQMYQFFLEHLASVL